MTDAYKLRVALAQSGLPPSAVILGSRIIDAQGLGKAVCYLSLPALALESGMNERTARRALVRLREGGWLVEQKGGGRGRATRRRIALPEGVSPTFHGKQTGATEPPKETETGAGETGVARSGVVEETGVEPSEKGGQAVRKQGLSDPPREKERDQEGGGFAREASPPAIEDELPPATRAQVANREPWGAADERAKRDAVEFALSRAWDGAWTVRTKEVGGVIPRPERARIVSWLIGNAGGFAEEPEQLAARLVTAFFAAKAKYDRPSSEWLAKDPGRFVKRSAELEHEARKREEERRERRRDDANVERHLAGLAKAEAEGVVPPPDWKAALEESAGAAE